MTPEDGPVVATHPTHIFPPAPTTAATAMAGAASDSHAEMKAEDERPDAGPSRPRRPSHPQPQSHPQSQSQPHPQTQASAPPPNLMDNDDDPSVPPPSTARAPPAAPVMSHSRSASSSHSHSHSHQPPRPASPSTTLSPPRPPTPHLDLATYPTPTLLRLLASLLQQIATSNDQLRAAEPEDEYMDEDTESHTHPHTHHAHPLAGAGAGADGDSSTSNSGRSHASRSSVRPSPTTALFDTHSPASPPASSRIDPAPHVFSASRTSLVHPSSLLSFHARHVPSITIEAYLLRILKYCPTTNEVFLSLLVYFDRMSRLGTAMQLARNAAGGEGGKAVRGLAIDSFNVHRLVIAGVTVASKFFSDVFYTNSRYAKVGGLPSHELNQLELQFLLLNDFRLTVPPDEMQRYADRLLGYWEGKEAAAAVAVSAPTSAVEDPPAAGPVEAAQPAQAMQVDSPAESRPAAETLTEGAAEEVAPARRTQTALPEITARGKERDTDDGPNVLPPGTASAPAPAPIPV